MKAAIVSGLALVASVVTPVFADELVGPPAPEADVVAEPEAPVEAEKPAGKPLELRPNRASDGGGAGGFGIGMKLAAVAAVFGGAFLLFKRRNGGFASARTSHVGPRIVSRSAGTGDWQEGKRFASSASDQEVASWIGELGLSAE